MESSSNSAHATMSASGSYFDGQSARVIPVKLQLTGSLLVVRDAATDKRLTEWPLSAVRHVDAESKKRRPLTITVAEDGPTPIGVSPQDALPHDQRLTIQFDAEGGALTQAILDRAPNLTARSQKSRGLVRTALFALVGAGVAVALVLFVLIPMLSERLARMVPPETEIKMGADLAKLISSSSALGGEPCSAPRGVAALQKMTTRLEWAAGSHVPIHTRVVNRPEINAFAIMGGQIFIFSGLIKNADSPEEVAGVLAHEIGHVVGRDSLEKLISSGATFGVISVLVGDFSGSILLTYAGAAAVEAKFSRAVEAEADDVALRILKKADLPARPLSGFFKKLIKKYGDQDSLFASHPLTKSRAEKFAKAPAHGGAPVLTAEEWAALRAICDDRAAPEARPASTNAPAEKERRPESSGRQQQQ
ncbi:MAG: M48 family metallopeptidase [Neomegalonema sp.]|nr:M48 family metallopeptidase [Neomegalonema sp.]